METNKSLKIGVWEATRDKLDAIAASQRWTLAVTVDALADKFIAEHSIVVPDNSNPQGGDDNGNAEK